LPALDVRLDSQLPAELTVGRGTALFVCGTCFEPGERIASLALVIDGDEQPVIAHGMPRLDLMRATGESAAYRAGFWGFARIGARDGGAVDVRLRARLAGGATREEQLARIGVAALPEPLPGAPKVAICMATHEPPIELFRRQIESIRAQTERDWLCVVADDCSRPDRLEEIRAVLGDDERFVLATSDRRRGFYANFERALALAPAEAPYVALADQDDAWHPDKLAALLAALDGAQLVYSDQRVVTRDGSVVAGSYWEQRANNHASLLSLLAANAVTGAASLFPRSLLDDALPFPPAQFAHFHDHWLALTARALGDIRYVDRPLYDYVQHGGAALGHANATATTRIGERLARRRGARERIRLWRMHYFVDVCRLMQFATVLEMRCGERMTPPRRRALARFLRADGSAATTVALAVRGLRDLTRRRPQTLGAEWMLSLALAWRRLLAATARDRPQRVARLDAVPPPVLDPRPGGRAPSAPELRAVCEKIAPLRLAVREGAPRRINLLIPTFDLRHFFGGYIAKLNLARALAQRGLRVRIVTVDPVGSLPRTWKSEVESYAGLGGLFEAVEVAFGRESPGLEVSRDDAFVATTWWTAHIAHAALDGAPFLYLVQEYEPFTFAMGSYAALADESYRFPHSALFSSELLRDFFRRRGLGVYAAGTAAGDASSAAFENAITAVEAPPAADLAERRPRRLLFYARPEPHAARNMFELGVLALSRAIDRGAFAGWELDGIGTVHGSRRLDLGGNASLRLLPRAAQVDYGRVLRSHDVGLALMYTPHPSLVPIEMASAGMLAVTNTFENKTATALATISPNLIAAEPGIEPISDALVEAAAAADDGDRRVRGSRVRWSRDWGASFGDELIDRLVAFLGP
jgi:GT2 family glycosyltransferase